MAGNILHTTSTSSSSCCCCTPASNHQHAAVTAAAPSVSAIRCPAPLKAPSISARSPAGTCKLRMQGRRRPTERHRGRCPTRWRMQSCLLGRRRCMSSCRLLAVGRLPGGVRTVSMSCGDVIDRTERVGGYQWLWRRARVV